MLWVVHDVEASNEPAGGSLIDEIVRDGARQMLAAALQDEVAAYVEQFKDEFDEHGRRLVVRNGFHAERKRFGSAILPAWARKSPRVAEVLPLLYLHGLSSSDFAPALTQFLGTSHGLSAATITRLTNDWQDEATAFNKRSLADTDYVYLWVDGIHLEVRLEQDKVCLLVMIGVRADGTKELVALTDGHRESSESWADLLRDCKRRGMAAPVLAIGDGALGFWAALRDVFPATRQLPRRALGPPAYHEPDRVDLRHRPPSAVGHQGARIAGGRRGDGVQAHRSAQQRWRAVNAPHLVALVRAGARFEKGLLVERPDEAGGDEQVA
jgi:putative transposase